VDDEGEAETEESGCKAKGSQTMVQDVALE
jgi:hypothetical protein